jgi:hypothetical protein
MSLVRASTVSHPAGHSPVSPHALATIADEALASGDTATAVRFIEMAYQAADDAEADASEDSFPSTADNEFVG